MRLIRWTTGIAHSLHGHAVRVHRRTEHLPRLPFGIALGVSILLLLMAIETSPATDTTVTEVDELAHANEVMPPEGAYATTPATLDIVEFGFGRVTDQHGAERLTLGAVIRNPHEALIVPSTLTVTAIDGQGAPFMVEQIYLNPVPAESSVAVGYVLLTRPEGINESTLDITVADAQMWAPPEEHASDVYWYPLHDQEQGYPQIHVVDIQPLFSPEGYRIVYQIEAHKAMDHPETVKIAIVFRDGQGRIIGGMPGWEDPSKDFLTTPGHRTIPPGLSLQYLDLPLSYLPEAADLNRVQISVGV